MKYIKPIDTNKPFEGYTLKEIVAKLKNGSLKINHNKHNDLSFSSDKQSFHSGRDINKYLIDYLEGMYNDDVKYMNRKDRSTDLDKFYKEIANKKFLVGNQIISIFNLGRCECMDCGSTLKAYVQDENTIGFLPIDYVMKNGNMTDIDSTKVKECEITKLNIKDKLVAEVNVESGELVFVNFFKNDAMNDQTDDDSINDLLGRYNLMQYLAKNDIVYCQMSNMSVDVFSKDDGTEIIVGESDYYNEETDEEDKREFPGFKYMGYIGCDVWRWMCADKKVLEKYGEEIPKRSITVKVTPGTWIIEHYYDVIGDRPDGIYSKMYLK